MFGLSLQKLTMAAKLMVCYEHTFVHGKCRNFNDSAKDVQRTWCKFATRLPVTTSSKYNLLSGASFVTIKKE